MVSSKLHSQGGSAASTPASYERFLADCLRNRHGLGHFRRWTDSTACLAPAGCAGECYSDDGPIGLSRCHSVYRERHVLDRLAF